jgi:hypothetical protein
VVKAEERKASVSVTVNQLEVDFKMLTPVIPASEKLQVVVIMTNRSAGNLRLNALLLNRPRVLLKARTMEGVPVNPGPPGMPPLDDGETGRKILKPGESVTFQYTGQQYFGTELSAGEYQMQFRYENTLPQRGDWTGTVETEWLDFEVRPLVPRKQ